MKHTVEQEAVRASTKKKQKTAKDFVEDEMGNVVRQKGTPLSSQMHLMLLPSPCPACFKTYRGHPTSHPSPLHASTQTQQQQPPPPQRAQKSKQESHEQKQKNDAFKMLGPHGPVVACKWCCKAKSLPCASQLDRKKFRHGDSNPGLERERLL